VLQSGGRGCTDREIKNAPPCRFRAGKTLPASFSRNALPARFSSTGLVATGTPLSGRSAPILADDTGLLPAPHPRWPPPEAARAHAVHAGGCATDTGASGDRATDSPIARRWLTAPTTRYALTLTPTHTRLALSARCAAPGSLLNVRERVFGGNYNCCRDMKRSP
jgi:hypothetical protein